MTTQTPMTHRGVHLRRVAKGWYEIDTVTLTENQSSGQRVLHRTDVVPAFGLMTVRQYIDEVIATGGRPSMSGKLIINKTGHELSKALSWAGPFTVEVSA